MAEGTTFEDGGRKRKNHRGQHISNVFWLEKTGDLDTAILRLRDLGDDAEVEAEAWTNSRKMQIQSDSFPL